MSHPLSCLCPSCCERRIANPGAPPPEPMLVCTTCRAHHGGPTRSPVVRLALCGPCRQEHLKQAMAEVWPRKITEREAEVAKADPIFQASARKATGGWW